MIFTREALESKSKGSQLTPEDLDQIMKDQHDLSIIRLTVIHEVLANSFTNSFYDSVVTGFCNIMH